MFIGPWNDFVILAFFCAFIPCAEIMKVAMFLVWDFYNFNFFKIPEKAGAVDRSTLDRLRTNKLAGTRAPTCAVIISDILTCRGIYQMTEPRIFAVLRPLFLIAILIVQLCFENLCIPKSGTNSKGNISEVILALCSRPFGMGAGVKQDIFSPFTNDLRKNKLLFLGYH